jgi:hypothetical protein
MFKPNTRILHKKRGATLQSCLFHAFYRFSFSVLIVGQFDKVTGPLQKWPGYGIRKNSTQDKADPKISHSEFRIPDP